MITGLYAAILALIQIWYSFDVIKLRRAREVSVGDGGYDDLARRIRIHANFIETVPIALILLGVCELSGAPFWLLYSVGGVLVLGRLMHRFGLVTAEAPMFLRVGGMVLTFCAMIAGACTSLWLFYLTAM